MPAINPVKYPMRLLELLFVLVTLATVIAGAARLQDGLALQTDLLSLLPPSADSNSTRAASEQLSNHFGNAFVVMLAGDNQDDLAAAGRLVSTQFSRSRWIALDDNTRVIDNQLAYFQALTPYRFQLLTASQRDQLRNQRTDTILQQAWQTLYSPGSLASIASTADDPLQLFNHYLDQSYTGGADIEVFNNTLFIHSPQHPEQWFTVISGQVTPGAFNLEAQQAVLAATTTSRAQLAARFPDIRLYRSGAVFHGGAAASAAKREISLIAGGSAIGIVLLFLVSFRSLRPLLLSVASLTYGGLCALVFCQWYFQTLHLLTLVFGASLIGVAIDYALHYLTRAAGSSDQRHWLHRLLPSLSLGLATSLIGYASLLQAPLPGLQQMAVFSMTGLACAWLFVVVVLPRCPLNAPLPKTTGLSQLALLPQRCWQALSPGQTRLGLALLLALALITLLLRLHGTTDIRVLYNPGPQLVTEQAHTADILPSHASNQFFLLSASSSQQLLQRAEGFKTTLQQLQRSGAIDQYQLISDFIPPVQRQQADRQLLTQGLYRAGGSADQWMNRAGFDTAAIDRFHQQLQSLTAPLELEPWLEVAPLDKQLLWLGKIDGQYTSLVLLQGVNQLAPLHLAAEDMAGIRFVDTVQAVSTTLAAKRQSASQLLALAYAAIALLLLLRYRRWQAITLLAVPLLSSLFTLALLSSAGMAISLFHVFALFLVLGLGMDYSIFLYESTRTSTAGAALDRTEYPHCQLAILLSMMTSGLSFGLLSFSSTPMISAFGATVLIGSVLNWLLVPLIAGSARHPGSASLRKENWRNVCD